MQRTAPIVHRASSVAVGALLAAGLFSSGPVTVHPSPVLQAVVAYAGTAADLPGVQVVSALPGLRLAVVRGDRAALTHLAGLSGVTGITPDDAVQLAEHDTSPGKGLLAATGLGGNAGDPGAGTGTRVAVLDTGVSDTPALNRASGHLVDAVDTTGDDVGGPLVDGYGHGTFMAGLIAGGPVDGTDDQAIGIAPGATVVVVRVGRPDGSTRLSSVLGGLEWVYDHPKDVNVANLSFAHERPAGAYGADPLTVAVERVVQAGVTVVVAAGNTAGQVGDPGFDPRVLTVGAADLSRRRVAPFSGAARVGPAYKPDLVASGVGVLGLLPSDSVLGRAHRSSRLPNGLNRGSGTSQATAITSGTAALLLADHPLATPVQVKASLRCATKQLRGHRDGAGLLQLPETLCADAVGRALDDGRDLSGEMGFPASSWSASSWSASSWSASSWSASSWSASSWSASSWSASSWSASSWSGSSWSASSWSASSWSASSWSDASWSDSPRSAVSSDGPA